MHSNGQARPALLGLFWFGIQMVWGALLGVSLQARASQIVPTNAIVAYGELAIAGAACAALTQIVAGIFSDVRRRHGSRRIEFYISGTVAAIGALFWFYSATSFAELVVAFVVLELVMNVAIGPYQAVIPDVVADRQVAAASSWMAALQSAGNAAGAMLAGTVMRTQIVAGALSAALLVTCLGTVSHLRGVPMLTVRSHALRVSRSFVDLFVSRGLAYLSFYTLLGYLFFYVQSSVAATQAQTKTLTAIVLLTFTVAGAAGAALTGASAKDLDRRLIVTAAGAIFIAALFGFLSATSFPLIALAATVAGAAWGAFLTADWALGCAFLPKSALATAMGVWNLAVLTPQIGAPLIATALLSALHAVNGGAGVRIAFILAAFEMLSGVCWIWRLPGMQPSVETRHPGNTA